MYDFNGKIAIITGGASGIGYSICKEILQIGARAITIVDINEKNGQTALEQLTKLFGTNKAIFVKTDVTKQEEFEDAFEKTLNAWKTIDILVNNAGVLNDRLWEYEISLNATSVVRGTLLGLQYMSKDKNGRGGIIVNIASIMGLQEGISSPIYAATKHFVIGFSRSLGASYHYERTGVKFITVCPGYTVTPLVEVLESSDTNFRYPELRQVFKDEFENAVPQSSEKVAQDVITTIQEGNNGSIWVSENNEKIYEIVLPDRKTMQK